MQDDEFRDFIVDDEPGGPGSGAAQPRRRIRRTGLPAGVSGAALRVLPPLIFVPRVFESLLSSCRCLSTENRVVRVAWCHRQQCIHKLVVNS